MRCALVTGVQTCALPILIDAAAFIGFDAVDRQALIFCAARDDHRAAPELASVGELQAISLAVAVDRRRAHRRHQPRAELLRLNRRTERQLVRSEEHTSELQSLMRISYAVLCVKNKKKC